MSHDHYFSKKPHSRDERGKIITYLRGRRFSFITSGGVFSSKRVDTGTRVLVENMIIPKEGDFLDLGCGIGVIGIVAALLEPDLRVYLSDINRRAVQLTGINVERLGLENCEVYEGDLYESLGGLVFDSIVSNPPISAGMHDVVYPMVSGAYDRLVDGGRLQMVIQSNKGGNLLESFFLDVFDACDVLAKQSGYRVFTAVKR